MEDMVTRARDRAVSLDDLIAGMPPEMQRRIEERGAELLAQHKALAEVRKMIGRTQSDMAERLGIAQGGVARMEARSDMLLSTLRGYVRALGGDLRLVLDMPGREPMELEGLGDLAPVAKASTKPVRKASLNAARPRTARVA